MYVFHRKKLHFKRKKENVKKFAAFAELNGNTLPKYAKAHITYGGL